MHTVLRYPPRPVPQASPPSATTPASSARERVVCGIRATGRLHLGNYFGAIRPFLDSVQAPDVDAFFFVADLHTLTTVRDADALRTGLPALVLDCLAAGVDPMRVALYAQSSVPETSELAWLLGSVTYVGELERVPSFKERERTRSDGEPVNAGMLNYPLLMAADILGPRATRVPVGEDQYPHIELVRDIARRFNRRYLTDRAPYLTEPDVQAAEPVRVPGLDGAGKMGKSAGNTLGLFDPPEERWARLAKAVTDPARRTRNDPGTPERCNVYAIHQLVSKPAQVEAVAAGCRTAGIACIDCKRVLDDGLGALLDPMALVRRELAARPDVVRAVLHEGAARARPTIAATRDVVQEGVGIVRYGSASE